MSSRCEFCDADPCFCGGQMAASSNRAGATRSGPRGIDEPMREFVLAEYDAGARLSWGEWRDLLIEKFGPDRSAVRNAWNRVSNNLGRDWLLIDSPEPGGPMMHPSHYPQVRRLPLPEAIAAIEQLIATGGWTAEDKGLRLWQVVQRIPEVVYISIYDALHYMNRRDHLVTTTSPNGKPSQFWYVRPSAAEVR